MVTITSSFIKNKKTKQILIALPKKQISEETYKKFCDNKKVLWRIKSFE